MFSTEKRKRFGIYIILAFALALVGQQIDWITQLKNAFVLDPRTFAFTRTNGKSASGDLSSAGIAKTITLTPCPKGVKGVNTNHYLRISGGSGTAESALITGGTCASETANGTIQVTTANTHTGAWVVSSATAGIQEALNYEAKPHVVIPAGQSQIYAQITLPLSSTIEGSGGTYSGTAGHPTELVFNVTDGKLFNVINDHCTLKSMVLTGNGGGTAVSGSYGVYLYAADADGLGAITYTLEDLYIKQFYDGCACRNSANSTLLGIRTYINENDGFVIQNCQGRWIDTFAQGNKGDGFDLSSTSRGGAVPFADGAHTFDNQGYGVNSATGLNFHSFYFNFDKAGEVKLNSNTTTNTLNHGHIELAGSSTTYGTNATAIGIEITGTASVLMNTVFVNTSQGKGVVLDAGGNQLVNCNIVSNGLGAGTPGEELGLEDNGGSNIYTGNYFAGAFKFDVGGSIFSGNKFAGGTTTLPLIQFACTSGSCGTYNFNGNTINKVAGATDALQTDANTVFQAPFSNAILAGNKTLNGVVVGDMILGTTAFAQLGTAPAYPVIKYCSDCQVTSASDNTAKAGGSGGLVVAINSVWRCFALQN